MYRALGISIALLCCMPPFASPQQSVPPLPAAPSATDAANGGIQLDVIVTDKAGKPVSGLDQSDFTLLDNGQPAKIAGFHAYDPAMQPAPPVEVIVLFDTVNQDFTAVSYEREQVEKFLRQNGGHLAQPVAIYWLTNENVEAQGEPSLDGNAVAEQLQATEAHLRTINRTSGFYGAMELFDDSVKMLSLVAEKEAAKPGRKLLIWVGPGWPMLEAPGITYSTKTQKSLFQEIVLLSTVLRQGHISLYSISLGLPGVNTYFYQSFLKGVKKANDANPGSLALKVLAVQSGGQALSPSNDLVSSIGDCVRDAGAFYSMTIEPAPADKPDEYHELKVRIGKPGLTARTSTGYYSHPAGPPTP